MSALGSVIERRLAFVTSLLKQNRSQWPSGKQQDPRTGGWATLCVESYWLQLEYTFNEVQALSEKGQSPRYSLALFLERFSQPSSMLAYLKSLRRSRLSVTGTDNTLAQNIVLSNLVRLVLRRWPLNYSWNAGIRPALVQYLQNSLDPTQSAWGQLYELQNDTVVFVPDLSTNFHLVKYLSAANVTFGPFFNWNSFASTLANLGSGPFPWGVRVLGGAYWNHNNYDLVTLFANIWPHVDGASARNQLAITIESFTSFALSSLRPDGSWPVLPFDESQETAEYFGVSMLAVCGYFNVSECFWSSNTTLCQHSSHVGSVMQVSQLISAFICIQSPASGSYYASALKAMGASCDMHGPLGTLQASKDSVSF